MSDRTASDELRTLNRLVEISLALNSSVAVEAILTDLMDASAEILDAESASVILLDPHTRELQFVAITTESAHAEKLTRIPIPVDQSIAGEIVVENKNIILDDVSTHPKWYRITDSESGFITKSLLGVPMRIGNRVVGALEAVNKINGRWTENDVRYLEILASHAAVALEKAELIDDLKAANEELSKVDKIKSDFIAIASHELRTPLGVILGYASFLKEEAEGQLGDHAAAVMNSALKMRSLIEDMTNLRLLNLGGDELQRDLVSVNTLIKSALGDALGTLEARGHRLSMQELENDVQLRVDRSKIVTALTNLVNNAVKFTPNSGRIHVEALDKPDEVWIKISDNGVGIPSDKLDVIFRTFSQVEDHMTRRHGGMGLGLSIVKAVAEVHGGRVWAESSGINQGSTFTLALPKQS
ncbi:MAG: GAF domain-containing sensor histidine kinase [Chloroflexi bacterium]|nr:GAF domain-containing sensor histidine kinase [Chloroflexota bacterium]